MNRIPAYSAKLMACSLFLVLAACVPLKYEYFEPSASSGKIGPWRGACGGADDFITFTSPNYSWVEIRLNVSEYEKGRIAQHPSLHLTIRKNVPIEFGPFANEEKAQTYSEWSARRVTVEATQPNILIAWGNGGRAALKLPATSYVLERESIRIPLPLPEFTGNWLEVELPDFVVDGAKLVVPPVRFERVEKFKATPLNC